ncbi:auxin-responsive protein SAUR67 [Ricinus communis]|uniref:auxin-responsive protein SAUR67 n=1 Tax=Ricinus communis TaxID=3988 RepID=UPI00201AA798|nr:auxin-responsive protein SAUR67 [Ricinus communis]
MGKNKIYFPSTKNRRNVNCSATSVAETGNFVVYTIDDQRFVIPLTFLSCSLFNELLGMSEELFGLPSQGPIRLPCDAIFMEYIVSLMSKGLAKDIEKALLIAIETSCCSMAKSLHEGVTEKQLLVACC